jgi:AmmeMemoRadiSam system protein B
MAAGSPVRAAAVAGTWYPGSAQAINAEVAGHLAAVPPGGVPGRLVALVSPHAGLRYSGPVAAFGYALLAGRRDLTCVLVGPSHRVAFDGGSVWARGSFETPLGRIPIDEELSALTLAGHPLITDVAGPHRTEHSLEMQLPFLQHLVENLRIVPILMGSQTREEVEAVAAAIASAVGARRDVLLVASSDLSHYHPAPIANRLDALVVRDVARFDSDGLMARLEAPLMEGLDDPEVDGGHHACGGGPIVAVMRAARALGATAGHVLRYADSGDAGERDKRCVVGYLSAALVA